MDVRHLLTSCTLLEINVFWNHVVDKYVSQIIERCTSCHATALPQPVRKVSSFSLSQSVTETICVDHFHLHNDRLLHVMDNGDTFLCCFRYSE